MSRKYFAYSAGLGSLLMLAALTGCGSDNREGAVTAERVSASSCFGASQCHATQTDPVTGNVIRTEVEGSKHFMLTQNTADCQGCHGGGSMHFGKGPLPYANPAKDGGCLACHQENNPLNIAHYNTAKAGVDDAAPATYVNKNVDCTFCHAAHNPQSTQIHTEWSGNHGNVNAAPFAEESFTVDARAACTRCHTTTGYIRFANGQYDTFPTTGVATAEDSVREVIACQACHKDYNFSANNLRTPGAFTASYKYNGTRVEFPDVNESNICVACHSGRESGDSVTSVTDFTNASFKNSHYLAAAAMLFSKSGFRYYTSNVKYESVNAHSQLGIANNSGTGNKGPCVACHLGPVGNSTHKFDALTVAANTAAGGCYGCHSTTIADEEESRAFFARFYDFYKFELEAKGIYVGSSYPYFFTSAALTSPIKNWTAVGPTTDGALNMGAAFNYKFITAEKGAHVHNRTYAKRLMTDAIQYLQTGTNTYSYSSGNLVGSTYIGGQTSANGVISFTAYSTAQPTFSFTDPKSGVVTDVSISTLKSQLLRNRSFNGQWFRR